MGSRLVFLKTDLSPPTSKMKFALILLVALPMVLCADERSLLDSFSHLFNNEELKAVVNSLVQTVGSDATEQVCEKECNVIVQHDILSTGCPLICRSLQSLAKHFQLQ